MDKLKRIQKQQLWLTGLFITGVLVSVILNQIIAKTDLISAAKHSYILTFIVANSNQTFDHVAPLLLVVLLIKDLIFSVFILICLGMYTLLQRSIVKKMYGYVKIMFLFFCLLILYVLVVFDVSLLNSMGIYSPLIMIEHGLFIIVLLLQTYFLICFVKQYTRYRKENNIRLISRQSMRQLAYATIKNIAVISTMVLFLGVVVIIVGSKLSMYVIEQLALENYFSQLYQLDLMQLFQNVPPLMQKIILQIKVEDWFYSIQNGMVIVDIHSIDYRVHAKLAELIRTNSIAMIETLLKVIITSALLFVLNRVYQKKQFMNWRVLLIMTGAFIIKILFVRIDFILLQICDIMYAIAIIIYVIDGVDLRFYQGELFLRIRQFGQNIFALALDKETFAQSTKVYHKSKEILRNQGKNIQVEKWLRKKSSTQKQKKRPIGKIRKRTLPVHRRRKKRAL